AQARAARLRARGRGAPPAPVRPVARRPGEARAHGVGRGGAARPRGRDPLRRHARRRALPDGEGLAASRRARAGDAARAGGVALLRAAVQAVAEREDIAPEVIASSRDIDALGAYALDRGALDDVAVVGGWRRTLVGETLLAIARGELAMRYDADRREVVADAV